jgi:cytochrome c oxidase subunit 3
LPDHGHTGNGNGNWKNLVPADGNLRAVMDYSPPPSSTAIWVVLFAVTMMFAAFTSALIVRKGSSLGLAVLYFASILYFNTLAPRQQCDPGNCAPPRDSVYGRPENSRGAESRRKSSSLAVHNLISGIAFCRWPIFRMEAARRSQGLYLATNPSSSFFYVLTAVHAVHVLGGLGGLIYCIRKLHRSTLRRNALVATARYWHFMGALWVYLLVLLWMKL